MLTPAATATAIAAGDPGAGEESDKRPPASGGAVPGEADRAISKAGVRPSEGKVETPSGGSKVETASGEGKVAIPTGEGTVETPDSEGKVESPPGGS